MNFSNVLLYISYVLELFIWLQTFNKILIKKYNKKIFYIIFASGDLILTLVKQYDIINPSLLTVVMFLYIIIGVYMLYSENKTLKIIVISSIFLLSCIADMIVAGGALIAGYNVESLTTGLNYSVASILSKIILYVIIRILFARKFKSSILVEYKELAVCMCCAVICETPCATIFKKMSLIEDNGVLLITFMLGQIVILSTTIYSWVIFAKRRNLEKNMQNRIRQIEIELQSGKDSVEILEFRHEIMNHLNVVNKLLEMNEVERAKQYLSKINKVPESKGDLIILNNKSMEIILNQKRIAAIRHKITLNINITEEIIMDDIDICSLIANLLDNAIEASGKKGYINFIIRKDEDSTGAFILCSNTYEKDKLIFSKGNYLTTKEDGKNHGFGIRAIKKIVKKYNGTVKFRPDSEWFNVEIYIPYKGE